MSSGLYGYREAHAEAVEREKAAAWHLTGVQGFFMPGLFHVLNTFYGRLGGEHFWPMRKDW